MKTLVLVLFLLLLPAFLYAQQGVNGIPGLSLVAPLKVSAGSDNHFLVDRTPPTERLFLLSLPPSVQLLAPAAAPQRLNDNVMMLTVPKLAFQNYGPRHELTITYVPEIEMFRQNSDLNTWNHDAGFAFGYHLSRRFKVSVGDSFVTSSDPASTLQNVFLLLPRSNYRANAFRGELDFQASGTTAFEFRYDKTRATYGQKTDPFQTSPLDSIGQGVSLGMTRMLSRTQRLRARVSLYRFEPINQGDSPDRVIRRYSVPLTRAVDLQYRIRVNPTTYLNFSGGATAAARGLTYTLGAGADRRIGSLWVGGGFARYLAFTALGPTLFANGLNPSGFYDALYLTAREELTPRTVLQFRATAARSSNDGFIVGTRSLMGSGRFDYRLSDRTVWFATFETFQQNKNEVVRSALSRNRFMVGIEFSFSDERDRRTNRLNEDGKNVPLTDHPRHRDTSQ